MIAVAATTNGWDLIQTAEIVGGITVMLAIVAVAVYACMALDKGRSFLPWSVRHRVEKARAAREVAQERFHEEEAELRYLALQPVRAKIVEAIENGDPVSFAALTAGKSSSEGDQMRQREWS